MLVDDLPESARIGVRRYPFVHHRGRAVRERTVDDVTVARDPADVGRAPEELAVAVVEHVLMSDRYVQQVAGRRVQDALRLPRRARRVKNEQRILRVHRLGRADLGRPVEDVLVPLVAAVRPSDLAARVLDDDDVLDLQAAHALQRFVDVGLQRNLLAAAHAFVGRDHDARRAVLDAALERLGREAAEHDGVHRADACAREHRDRGFGNHRHVDRDAVAFLDAEALQRIRELDRRSRAARDS